MDLARDDGRAEKAVVLGDRMSKPANSWGEMAAERDSLINAIVDVMDFHKALDVLDNTAYKADAIRQVNMCKARLDVSLKIAQPIVDKYRR